MTESGGTGRTPPGSRPALFLERQSYRRRRLTDAARLLPFLGAALLAIPLLWPDQTTDGGAVPLSSAMMYIFTCWALMILVGLLFGFVARKFGARDDADSDTD